MRIVRQMLACSALAVSLGCYKYVPGALDTTPVGSKVQALLSTEGQMLLEERVGIYGRTVTGELLEVSGDSVLLAVRSARASAGIGSLYQRVDFSRSQILRIDQRQLDAARTTGLIAVAAGGLALILSQVFGDSNPGQLEPPDGGQVDRIFDGWILRIPVRILRE